MSKNSEKNVKKKWNQCKQVKKRGAKRCHPGCANAQFGCGEHLCIMIYVQGGKLEGSEISEKRSEKEVESVQAVKKDELARGAIPVVLMRNLAVGNIYTIR